MKLTHKNIKSKTNELTDHSYFPLENFINNVHILSLACNHNKHLSQLISFTINCQNNL